jgi:hypothetical protein
VVREWICRRWVFGAINIKLPPPCTQLHWINHVKCMLCGTIAAGGTAGGLRFLLWRLIFGCQL